ncbi:MAG: toll/interleukin-1 receptor domain-containing protein [Gemmatimonadetes bacterium]|nr:toll/interleukin-1 receptor domain-containing protein [Gemmatimonadota bacterium]
MSDEPGFHAFISYDHAERPRALTIATRLRDGPPPLRIWIDVWELRPGTSFPRGTGQGLLLSGACVVLVGASGIQNWRANEAFAAMNRRRIWVIPVLIPGGDPEMLPPFLSELSWVDLQDMDDEQAFRALVWGITGERPTFDPPAVAAQRFEPGVTVGGGSGRASADESESAPAGPEAGRPVAPQERLNHARGRVSEVPAEYSRAEQTKV